MKNFLLISFILFVLALYIQDYLDNIQNYRYLKKENENKKEEALNKSKPFYKEKLKIKRDLKKAIVF